MKNFLSQIKDIGTHDSLDSEIVRKIHLTNSVCLLGFLINTIRLSVGIFNGWPINVILMIAFTLITICIPLILNHYGKYLFAKIGIILIANTIVFLYAIIFGRDAHIHHMFIPFVGLPFLILSKNEVKKTKLFLIGMTVTLFFIIDLDLTPLIKIDLHIFHLFNDLIVLFVTFAFFYLFQKESDFHMEKTVKVNEKLIEKNTELEHFAYIASHDLNEPLRTIDSFIEIIKEEYHEPKDEKMAIYFSYIHGALDRMRLMIDNLLEYSGLWDFTSFERTDINEVIDDIRDDLNVLITESNANLKAEKLPDIDCHPSEIKQLFQNLITNGIKFQTPESTPVINISYKETKSHWQFCVSDNGIGVKKEKQDEIFKMFTKLHKASKYKGQGIGLTFCKKIVEQHKGEIWVESSPDSSLKAGSRFYFTISKIYN